MKRCNPAGPLVESEWLAAHRHLDDPDVRVVEIDVNANAYSVGHIPGAVLWNVYSDLLQPDYRIIDRAAFADLLGRSGIRPSTTVVLYGYAASLGFWMLTHYGHRCAAFLNGSRAKWATTQLPMTTEASIVRASNYSVSDFQTARDDIRACHHQVLQAIADPDQHIMDVRSQAEYVGERYWPSVPPQGHQRGGHVPGAVLVPIEATWADDGTFKPVEELREYYASRGFTPDQEIITYCAVGGRASQAWFVLTQLLGYPRVRVYDASWIEWGMLPGVPVEV
jgi:thiosulfate/3-mercaptopyruvate sulfurtransferase